ncbi:MAG: hypothetical protein HDR00_09145 [Lachnospiraceae bacterium]|nr:hypothetical protein [Lachnospiraceae bacterium]
MLMSYLECIKKFGTDYQLDKQLECGNLFKIEKGIYSDKKSVREIDIITLKYPNAVFTLNSAFYFYSFTDVIPDKYILATDRNSAKIRDERVKQVFYPKDSLETGKVSMDYEGSIIHTYDKERLLIELVRYKDKFPFDYYKEIILSYRKCIMDMDLELLQDYAEKFPKSGRIMDMIQAEVF